MNISIMTTYGGRVIRHILPPKTLL